MPPKQRPSILAQPGRRRQFWEIPDLSDSVVYQLSGYLTAADLARLSCCDRSLKVQCVGVMRGVLTEFRVMCEAEMHGTR
jgi:hypothetical protein